MKKEIIKQIIRDFHREPLPETLPRDLKVPLNSSKIITLIGVRRSGKSCLLFESMKQLTFRENIPKERILYLNFEDERLELTQGELEHILQGYAELYPNLDLHESEILKLIYDDFVKSQKVPIFVIPAKAGIQ